MKAMMDAIKARRAGQVLKDEANEEKAMSKVDQILAMIQELSEEEKGEILEEIKPKEDMMSEQEEVEMQEDEEKSDDDPDDGASTNSSGKELAPNTQEIQKEQKMMNMLGRMPFGKKPNPMEEDLDMSDMESAKEMFDERMANRLMNNNKAPRNLHERVQLSMAKRMKK